MLPNMSLSHSHRYILITRVLIPETEIHSHSRTPRDQATSKIPRDHVTTKVARNLISSPRSYCNLSDITLSNLIRLWALPRLHSITCSPPPIPRCSTSPSLPR